MKKLIIVAAISLASCKPACSAIDQLQTTYAADIAAISALTGKPVSEIVDVLSKMCALGGEPAVIQEIANMKSTATAARLRAQVELKVPPQ